MPPGQAARADDRDASSSGADGDRLLRRLRLLPGTTFLVTSYKFASHKLQVHRLLRRLRLLAIPSQVAFQLYPNL